MPAVFRESRCQNNADWRDTPTSISLAAMKRLFALLALALGLVGARAQIYFDDGQLWLNHSRTRIEIEDLQNFSPLATGKLRVVLYATEDEWDDTHHREAVAYFPTARLKPDQLRHRLRKTVRTHRPDDPGWYWLTLTVQERVRGEDGKARWVIRDHYEFDERVYFAPRLRDVFWPF